MHQCVFLPHSFPRSNGICRMQPDPDDADASSEWDEKQLKMACELSCKTMWKWRSILRKAAEFSPVSWEAKGWNGWMSHMMATVCLSACAFRQALLWNTANFVRRLWPICADSDLSSSRGLTPISNHMMPTWPRCLEKLPTVTICVCASSSPSNDEAHTCNQ